MKKLYCFFFIVLSVRCSYSQVNVEAVQTPASRFQFINKNTGVPVNDMVWDETEPFVNGYAKVALHYSWGFVNAMGAPVIEPVYESLRNFAGQFAAAKQNSKWGFINEKGRTVIPFEYDIVFDFTQPVTAVYKNNKWSLINKQGVTIKALNIDVFWGFKNGVAKITRNGRNGLMNTNGEIISMEPERTEAKKINLPLARTGATQNADCPQNIDFEYGNFYNWYSDTGQVTVLNNSVNVITVYPSTPLPNRHVIIGSSNPSAIDPYGFFPINPPDGSGYAVKLGNDINGHQAERISFRINVPANSTNASITYRYAVVFQDPGHPSFQQPRFSAKLKDLATNTYLPCATYEYVATSSLPGFQSSPVNDSIKFKPWAPVYVNLSHYAGKTLELEFTTADCAPGAHWGYAYVDVGDCNISASVRYNCNPSQVIFTAPPGFQYYNWYSNNFSNLLGTGETLTLNSPPAPGTTIHVEVIPYNGFGCSDTLEVPYVAGFPTANAGPDRSICPAIPTSIGTTAVAGNTYSWSPGSFLSDSTAAAPTINLPASATYHLLVTNNTSGCTAEDSVVVTVNTKPVAAFNAPPPQCFTGNNFSFVNSSSIGTGSLTYQWNFGDGNGSTQTSPAHSYVNAGTYSVKLVATSNNGCKDSIINSAVTVNANPAVRTVTDASICRGNTLTLQTTGAQTYSWSPSQNLSCVGCASPVASPPVSSTYIVKGTDNLGCYAYDTVNITVFQPIQVDVSPDRSICSGDSIPLLATGTAASYAWWPGQGLNNTATTNPVASPASTTQYRVVGYDGHNCFNDTAYVTITVNPKPQIELGPDLNLSTGTVYTLHPTTQNGPIVWWQWTPAANLDCPSCPTPAATVKNNITYHVLIKNSYGCPAMDSINIRTFCEGSQVFVPNAFTPDGDGKNDILMVRATGIESVKSFRVFSRWGELVFEKYNFQPNDPSSGWDGKIRGIKGAPEVYVYTAEVICTNMETYVFKGNTTILK